MITARRQKQALHQYFLEEGNLPDNLPPPEQWTEPWREIFLLSEKYADAIGAAVALHQAIEIVAGDEQTANDLQQQIAVAKDNIHYKTLAEIAANLPPVSWLWEHWIPRGMISLLGAYQGTGKSYLILDLIRALLANDTWPDGTPVHAPEHATAVFVEAEGIPQVTAQRAQALGLDMNRIYLVMAEDGQLFDLTEQHWQDHLLDLVDTVRPELVIIDSLTSISSKGQNSVEDTNRLLMFLVALARYANCGVLITHHLRKPSSGQLALPGVNLHDFRGSGHITAMARTVIGLAVVQQPGRQFSLNGPRRIDLVKTNLSAYPDPLGITLHEDQKSGAAQFEYGPAAAYDQPSQAQSAEEWLLEYLERYGPAKPADIIADGETEGHSERTIYRVRRQLNDTIHNTVGSRSRNNKWTLEDPNEEEEEQEDDENRN